MQRLSGEIPFQGTGLSLINTKTSFFTFNWFPSPSPSTLTSEFSRCSLFLLQSVCVCACVCVLEVGATKRRGVFSEASSCWQTLKIRFSSSHAYALEETEKEKLSGKEKSRLVSCSASRKRPATCLQHSDEKASLPGGCLPPVLFPSPSGGLILPGGCSRGRSLLFKPPA